MNYFCRILQAILILVGIHGALASDLSKNLEVPKDQKCDLCKAVAGIVGPLIRSNISVDVIEEIAVQICIARKIDCGSEWACKDLCNGIVGEYGREIIEIASKTVLAPAQLCALLKLCPVPPPPPQPTPWVPVPSNLSDYTGEHRGPAWDLHGTGYFIQFSDAHLQMTYHAGSTTDCKQPLCCREADGPGNTTATTAGPWGHPLCDTAQPLLESMLKHIASLQPQPDFILYTGDDPAHDVWMQSRQSNLNAINRIATLVLQYLPDVPVFHSIGNHEAFPVNQYEGPGADSWLLDDLTANWSPWLGQDALRTLRYGGYYAARARPGLRVISLNTNYYPGMNYWLKVNDTDFSSQLSWLNDTLKQARQLGEKVILIGHGNPGGWEDHFALAFNKAVEANQDIIVNQFYGHAHASTVAVWRDNATDSRPISVGYVVGSVTTYQHFNPGFRTYTYDRDNFGPWLVKDFTQYWTDIYTVDPVTGPTDWNIPRYSPLSAYNMKDLTPASWQDLASRILLDHQLFDTYAINYVRGGKPGHGPTPLSAFCEMSTVSPSGWDRCTKTLAKKFNISETAPELQRFDSHCN